MPGGLVKVDVLVLVPRRELPSTRLRFREPSLHWDKTGAACRFVPIPSGPLERWKVLRQAAECNVVVLQKKTSLHPWDLSLLRRANPNLVFDFDDAVMFHEIEHRHLLSAKHFGKFLRTIRYFASGVPVVASPVGLNLDIVREGRNGYFASIPEEWEARMGALLSTPDSAREMGLNGIEDVARKYSLQAYAAAYMRVFRETGNGETRAGGG